METTVFEMPDVCNVVERTPIVEESEEYYRMTIELVLDNDIPFLYCSIN